MAKDKNTKQVSANFTELKFPQDRFSVTSELKRVVRNTMTRVRGNAEKKAIFDEVMSILAQYVEAKYAFDAERVAKYKDEVVAESEQAEEEITAKETEDLFKTE